MIYKCENKSCGFLFSRACEPEACPDCGKQAIRLADAQEQQEFEERQNIKPKESSDHGASERSGALFVWR